MEEMRVTALEMETTAGTINEASQMEEVTMEEKNVVVVEEEVVEMLTKENERFIKLIHTNKNGYEVYMIRTRDISSKRVSIELITVSPEGKRSNPFTIQRSSILNKKNCFDIFLNIEGEFDEDDIITIEEKVRGLMDSNTDYMDVQSKATMDNIYQLFSDYIRQNAEELKENPQAGIFIKDGYGYMKTTLFDQFIKDEKENLRFSRVEVLKRLKMLGALIIGEGRPFDLKVSIGGKKINFYKIKMLSKVEMEEEVDEIIEGFEKTDELGEILREIEPADRVDEIIGGIE